MKKIIILAVAFVAFATATANAQVVKEGKQYVATKSVKTSKPAEKTGFTYKDSKGNVYDIYISSTGSCYVNRVSSKTGKEYKSYLGAEISADICKQLGRKYTPKTTAVKDTTKTK